MNTAASKQDRIHYLAAASVLVENGYDIINHYVAGTKGGCLFAIKHNKKWPLDITDDTINNAKVAHLINVKDVVFVPTEIKNQGAFGKTMYEKLSHPGNGEPSIQMVVRGFAPDNGYVYQLIRYQVTVDRSIYYAVVMKSMIPDNDEDSAVFFKTAWIMPTTHLTFERQVAFLQDIAYYEKHGEVPPQRQTAC